MLILVGMVVALLCAVFIAAAVTSGKSSGKDKDAEFLDSIQHLDGEAWRTAWCNYQLENYGACGCRRHTLEV